MRTKLAPIWHALAVTGVASLAVPALAMPSSASMPTEQYQGSVGFITGGIGRREAKMFEKRLNAHPLAIELLEHAGKAEEFTANAMVRITDRQDHTVLAARAAGPFMLVDLPPGRYSIRATLASDTLNRSTVWINNGRTAHVTFEYPAGTDERIPVKLGSVALESARYDTDWLHGSMGG